MSDYGSWDDERERLLNAADTLIHLSERERVSDLLDRAERLARANNLREAANRLEEMRRVLVGHNLFHRWDDGILVFSGLIRHIRAMSAETTAPRDYQRFLDAIPSLHIDSHMSRSQINFWYGSTSPPPFGRIQSVPLEAAEPSASATVLGVVGILIAIAIVAYWIFW